MFTTSRLTTNSFTSYRFTTTKSTTNRPTKLLVGKLLDVGLLLIVDLRQVQAVITLDDCFYMKPIVV